MRTRGKDSILFARVSAAERALVEARAAADDCTVSEVIREALYAYGCDPFVDPTAESAPDVHRRGPVVTRTPRDSRPARRGEFNSGR